MGPRHDLTRRDLAKYAGLAGGLGLGLIPRAGFSRASQSTDTIQSMSASDLQNDETVAKFKEDTGITLEIISWTGSPDAMAKVVAGQPGVETVQMSNNYVRPTIERGRVRPIDTSRLQNYSQLFESFQKQDFATKDGQVYALPFVWGWDSMIYNPEHIPEVTSWKDLFDEKYAGRIALREDPAQSMMAAGLALGYQGDQFENLSTENLQEIKDFLISKKPLIRTLWGTYAESVNLMKSGEVWLMLGFYAVAADLAKIDMPVEFVDDPAEGAIGWVGHYVVPEGADSDDEAIYTFLDWVLGPWYGAYHTRVNNYRSISRAAIEEFTPDEIEELGLTEEAQQEKLASLNYQVFPENFQEWIDVWTEFKNA